MKDWKQNVRTLEVQQGSTYPVLFNKFLNDLFLCIKKSHLHNFTDNNAITVTCNTLTEFLRTLEQESESAVSWFKQNEMSVTTGKFKAIILNKKSAANTVAKTVDKNEIKSTKFVKLFGIAIDDRLKFDQHISVLRSKVLIELNALCQLQKYTGKAGKIAILTHFSPMSHSYTP